VNTGNIESASIPYDPEEEQLEHPEAIVVYMVTGDGTLEPIARSVYADGAIGFPAGGAGLYVIGYNYVEFGDDIPDWAKEAVSFIAARELLIGIGTEEFGANSEITLGVFAANLLKAYGIAPLEDLSGNFPDVEDDAAYAGYIAAGRGLGILQGSGGLFRPERVITREEMFVLLYNILDALGELPGDIDEEAGGLGDFSDAGSVKAWAKDALDELIKAGFIDGAGGKINPGLDLTNAQMAQMIYNLFTR